MTFSCDGCGLCCKKAHLLPELAEFINDDGQCRHFMNNKCNIYHDRPLVCNVDKYYELHLSNEITRQDFYEKNHTYCLTLKEEEQAKDI